MTETNQIKLGQRIFVKPAENLQVVNLETGQPYLLRGEHTTVDTRIYRLLTDGDLMLADPKKNEPPKAATKK